MSLAAEDIEASAILDLQQACQTASSGRTAVDKSQVKGWLAFQDSLQALAEEVRQAAPTDLYPQDQLLGLQLPSEEVQQQQLQHITQVLPL